MKKFTVVFAVLLCLVMLTGCKKSVIEGTWADDKGITYTFNKDMTFAINISNDVVVGGTFSIPKDSDQITFVIDVPSGQNITNTATFALDTKNNTLTITGSDGATTVLYKKK